jgi:hypothetical protein
MNGHVFECYEEQSDRRQYAKTVESLERYVKKTFSDDLSRLFATIPKFPTLVRPPEPAAGYDDTEDFIWHEELKEFVKRKRTLGGNLATVHAVVWGQCSEAMMAKLKSSDKYLAKTKDNDCHWLIQEIRAVTLQFDQKRNLYVTLADAKLSYYRCRQKPGQKAND